MPSTFIRAAAGFFVSVMLLAPSVLVVESLRPFGAWVVIWCCLVAICLGLPAGLETRGLLILVLSVFCAAGGLAYVRNVSPSDEWIVKLFAEIFGLTGSGIGGNFIATGLLRREGKL
jgi:hypothetical protein